MQIPVYVDETDWSSFFTLLKNKSKQIFFHLCTACMPGLYPFEWQQTKNHRWCLSIQHFVANSPLNSCSFTSMCQWDQEEFVFPSSKNKSQQILFHSALHACQVYMQVNENKQNKSQHGALTTKTLLQTHGSTLMCLSVYVHETDQSSCYDILKIKLSKSLSISALHACQV